MGSQYTYLPHNKPNNDCELHYSTISIKCNKYCTKTNVLRKIFCGFLESKNLVHTGLGLRSKVVAIWEYLKGPSNLQDWYENINKMANPLRKTIQSLTCNISLMWEKLGASTQMKVQLQMDNLYKVSFWKCLQTNGHRQPWPLKYLERFLIHDFDLHITSHFSEDRRTGSGDWMINRILEVKNNPSNRMFTLRTKKKPSVRTYLRLYLILAKAKERCYTIQPWSNNWLKTEPKWE